jgi:hypothetical protein
MTLLVACGGSSEKGDAGAQLACPHFRSVMRDFTAHILTLDEFRGKLKEVNDNAKLSSEPGIAPNSQAMLAAVTQVDDPALSAAVSRFGDACKRLGL